MDFKEFQTDEALEQEGVKVDIGDGAWLKIARLGNPECKKLTERLMRPHRGRMRAGRPLPEDLSEEIYIEVLAKTVLLDWGGMKDGGKNVKYSTEEAMKRLRTRGFRDLVEGLAKSDELFRAEEIEIDKGN